MDYYLLVQVSMYLKLVRNVELRVLALSRTRSFASNHSDMSDLAGYLRLQRWWVLNSC
jgi:hypothetical protein